MPSRKRKYSHGKADDDLNNEQWMHSGMSTHGSAYLVNNAHGDGVSLGIMKNNKSKRYGCEHAEDVFIRVVKDKVGLLRKSPFVNTLILNVSKSPCSSTYKTSNKKVGCTEELINFQNNPYICPITGNEYLFKIIVIARAIYRQSESSRRAMEMMEKNGIQVATDVHRKKNGSPMAKEF